MSYLNGNVIEQLNMTEGVFLNCEARTAFAKGILVQSDGYGLIIVFLGDEEHEIYPDTINKMRSVEEDVELWEGSKDDLNERQYALIVEMIELLA